MSKDYYIHKQLQPDEKKPVSGGGLARKPGGTMFDGWKLFDNLSPEEKEKWLANEKDYLMTLRNREDF